MSRADPTVLLIDGNAGHASALELALRDADAAPFALEWVGSLARGLERLSHNDVWAVFLHLSLPDGEGLDALDRVRSIRSQTPVVVIGGATEETLCRAALMRGARDYLLEGHVDSYQFSRALRHIADHDLADRELFLAKERARVTLESLGDGVLSTDVLGRVSFLNGVAEELTGWSSHDAVGRPATEIFHFLDGVTRRPVPGPLAMAIRLDRDVRRSAARILLRCDGRETAIEDCARPIHDEDGRVIGAVMVFRDVGSSCPGPLDTRPMAQHDPLTALPNRLLLTDRVTQAMLLARRNHTHLAVLSLDLDGFGAFNDTLGHSAGDALLQSVAAQLTTSVRKSDSVSRTGGDEFLILLAGLDHPADAGIGAARIAADLRRTQVVGGRGVRVTASMGLATYPDNGDDAGTLIRNADTALHHAKARGRDTYQFFVGDMSAGRQERQSLEGQLQHAIEREELVLHYQPRVDLETGAITSVEALVRWQHPRRGLLLPGQFLAVAEETGLIVPLGQRVLREACRQTRAWIDAGLPAVPVAVNVSSLEFQNTHFLGGVHGALHESGLDARYLELELTETVLMRQAEVTDHTLERLRTTGVGLTIDDFGTGYSSLSYLTRLPVDALKLDRSFVHDIGTSADGAIVVAAVISLGRTLRHRVIAEGVETQEQLAFLRAHSCDEGQGYLFSRPVEAAPFARLLQNGALAARQMAGAPHHSTA